MADEWTTNRHEAINNYVSTICGKRRNLRRNNRTHISAKSVSSREHRRGATKRDRIGISRQIHLLRRNRLCFQLIGRARDLISRQFEPGLCNRLLHGEDLAQALEVNSAHSIL
jgi:hypothetical protein